MNKHRVVVLALDGVYPFELGVPDRIFGGVAGGAYEVITASVSADRQVIASPDLTITVAHGPEALDAADTVIIPPYDLARFSVQLPSEVTAALQRIPRTARIVSLCTGAFTLAAAGLLDGLRATTHWAHADEFHALFPLADLDPDVLFVDTGRILTSAGVASAIDVCLHLVRQDHGSVVANRVARQCVTPPWREGGQAQYVEAPVPNTSAQGTGAARAWALMRLADPIGLSDLAQVSGMPVRTFTRRFTAETGISPGRWITDQRLTRARALLEATDLPIEQVATEVGFSTSASLRQHFHASVGITPKTYRATFRGTIADEK